MPTATVKLMGPDGMPKVHCAVGTGPVDAAYKAVDLALQLPVELTSYSMDVRVPHPVGPTGSSPHSHPTPVELTSYSMDVRVPHPVGPTGREYCHAAVRPIPKRLTARADSPCTPRKCGRFSSYKGFILCLPRPIRTTQITASL
jgi:hypothetical protein